MGSLLDAYNELENYLNRLEQRFLAPFIPAKPEEGPEEWDLDVKSFCVLAHAACEEYCETLSMALMRAAIEKWEVNREPTDVLLMLLLCHECRIMCETDEAIEQERGYDLLRKAVQDAKGKHSRLIHNNHGLSVGYLRAILTPVGVDTAADPALKSAIQRLATVRGSFAHKMAPAASYSQGGASKQISPEDAKVMATDVLAYCKELADRSDARLKPER
jgi:hypothetical protein